VFVLFSFGLILVVSCPQTTAGGDYHLAEGMPPFIWGKTPVIAGFDIFVDQAQLAKLQESPLHDASEPERGKGNITERSR